MSPNDPRAVARANRLLAFFGQTYWTEYYRERLVAQRSDDVLVQLLYSQLSPATQKRIFTVLGLDKGVRP
jgi:HrpA-like RNA helicase